MPSYTFQPSSYPLHYPPEIAAIIAGFVGEDEVAGDGWYSPSSRNSYLLHLALVSSVWASVAVSLLYSDLKLQWRASTLLLLLKTLGKRPELCARIRRLEMSYPTRWMLAGQLREKATLLSEDELKRRWDALSEAERAEVGAGEDAYDEWCSDEEREASLDAVDEGPDKRWARDTLHHDGEEIGSLAFWRFVATLPRLRHLAVENVKFLVSDGGKPALDSVIKRLDSFTIYPQSDTYQASPPVDALAAAENLHTLRISNHSLASFDFSLDNPPFPHLRHLEVLPWERGEDPNPSSTNPGSQLSEACPILDLALTVRDGLESLVFNLEHSRIWGPPPRPSNRLVGEALARLPNLRTLTLSESDTDTPPHNVDQPEIFDRTISGAYPANFLDALASSNLQHFSIADAPHPTLLAALPVSLTSLTFDPSSGPEISWLYEAMLDQLVQILLKAKLRLPALRLITLNFRKSTSVIKNSCHLSDPKWEASLDERRSWYYPSEEEKLQREERQLRREKLAADVGVCLRSRPAGR
ncbi:hypothetical protein RQP46_004235 [Phenoliferia psychrophenolica]